MALPGRYPKGRSGEIAVVGWVPLPYPAESDSRAGVTHSTLGQGGWCVGGGCPLCCLSWCLFNDCVSAPAQTHVRVGCGGSLLRAVDTTAEPLDPITEAVGVHVNNDAEDCGHSSTERTKPICRATRSDRRPAGPDHPEVRKDARDISMCVIDRWWYALLLTNRLILTHLGD